MKMSTSRSHAMRRQTSEKLKKNEEHTMYRSSLRAQVLTDDEALKRLFAAEIEKAGVVTAAGYNAVFSNFLQSQIVTEAVEKREEEKKRNSRRQYGMSGLPFRFSASGLSKPTTSKIVPVKTEGDNHEVNIAPRKSILLTADEHEQLLQYTKEYQKKAEEKFMVDSFLQSFQSKDEETDHIFSSGDSCETATRKNPQKEIVVVSHIEASQQNDCVVGANSTIERHCSASSLQLKDIFDDVNSDDDEVSSIESTHSSSCSSYSSHADLLKSSPNTKEISSDCKNGWLPWPKKNDGDDLLVSFPSCSGDNFLSWRHDASNDTDGEWERHYV
eukprot:CCRYP_000288-RA/>CCRYP_000288-RA protein AED:0.14 eAED:0.14 QI:0/-1/0/1/-1/1/1/0/328